MAGHYRLPFFVDTRVRLDVIVRPAGQDTAGSAVVFNIVNRDQLDVFHIPLHDSSPCKLRLTISSILRHLFPRHPPSLQHPGSET